MRSTLHPRQSLRSGRRRFAANAGFRGARRLQPLPVEVVMATPAIRLRHVLCPTDFPEFSARALRHAATIARAQDSQLTVVHVSPWSAPVGGGVPPAMVQLLGPAARQKLVDRLQAFVEPARMTGLSPRTILLEGDPAREIRRLAEALSADMLVLGTHGRSGLARFVRGSVAEELLRRSPCPVLTVCHAERAETPLERILCATDLRSPAGEEVAHAASIAAGCGAELTVLHVLDHGPGPYPGGSVGGSVRSALRWSYEQNARQRLRTVVPAA